jgi:Tol biopolymer transport system component
MRSFFATAALSLLACSSSETTEPPSSTESPGENAFELAYADVAEDLGSGGIYITRDASRGRPFADLPNGPDFPADWSPDGRTLLFRHDEPVVSSLWLIEEDGSGLRRLTPETENVVGAGLWIPGASRIAYVRRGPSALEWRTIGTDGSDPRSLMGLLTTDVSTIAWSPDGSRIAFNKGSLAGLWIANADGSDARQLTTSGYDYYARWSPDGARIAFQTEPLFGSPSRRIGVVDASGANRRVLTEGLIDERPIWSPDSRRIAFEKQILVNGEQVCTLREVDASGGIAVDILPRRPVRACPNAAWRRIATTR